jgi:hypothetical protein
MADNKLMAGLKERSIDVVYTVPVIDRLLEKGEQCDNYRACPSSS